MVISRPLRDPASKEAIAFLRMTPRIVLHTCVYIHAHIRSSVPRRGLLISHMKKWKCGIN